MVPDAELLVVVGEIIAEFPVLQVSFLRLY